LTRSKSKVADEPKTEPATAAGSGSALVTAGSAGSQTTAVVQGVAGSGTAQTDSASDMNARVRSVLDTFVTWSDGHKGAACPDAATIGTTADDPWKHPFRITCTDQPADQIVGVVSSGPDGVPGTADDVASWQLGPDLTKLVQGPRWVTNEPITKTAPTAASTTGKRPHSKHGASSGTKTTKPSTDVQLDENGLPISR
jgi:hypothetical protein